MINHKSYRMGTAPYRFKGVFSYPSTALAESNPQAYNNQMASAPKSCRGMCDHCGMGIMHHYMLKDAKGDDFVVGSDCISKLDNVENISKVEYARKKHNRELARARAEKKREAKRVAYEAKLQTQRDINGGLTDREMSQEKARAEAQAKRDAISSKVAYFADHLSTTGFAGDLRRGILDGNMPRGRGLTIMLEMIAKTAGRKNSKAYNAKYDEAQLELDKFEETNNG